MVLVKIREVDVEFPFEPYGCQISYMEKVIQCLQEGKNGILESPTGTGKTLCLLCATLAWREAFAAHVQYQQGGCSDTNSSQFRQILGNQLGQAAKGTWDSKDDKNGPSFEIPKVIYASRTHSQLSQAIQELKNTVYSPKVSVIGSREQMCINSEVMKQETNSAKVHMCKAKVLARTCHFHNNLEANKANPEYTQSVLDIEDLVTLGQKHKVCPYYMAKELKTSADIIFMPYNYLLDPKSRKANNIDISGSVVIFDEAHNLEKICEDSASFDLTSFDIASCIEDIDQCLNFVLSKEDGFDVDERAGTDFDVDPDDLGKLKVLFHCLEEEVDKIPLSKSNGTGVSLPGRFMFELLRRIKITFETKDQVLEMLNQCNSLLANDTQKFKGKHFALQKFGDSLQTVFSRDSLEAGKSVREDLFYKVHVQVESDANKKKKNLNAWVSGSKSSKPGRTLSYWCFSPGHTMRELMSYGVRSVVLTSGTLSPLNSFTAEMQIPFPVQLENPHVIERHQMMVGVVTKAPDGATLNSSYQTRFTPQYMSGLGNTIVNFSRTVPNGLLVFFPSYPVMNKCLEHWQGAGIWSRIAQHKPLFAEPKGKVDFIETMSQFYQKIKDPDLNGAIFFAVCRGKVSEGLDFADINGRAVVITGLPFPPRLDPKVCLKMQFLDEMSQKRSTAFKGLSGREWYRQQASRAVNQAIGRVIRHKQDFGAILLCDVRFTYPDAIQQLPSWLRPYVKVYKEFGLVQRDLIQFFRTADKLVVVPAMKVKCVRKDVATTASSRCDTHSAQGGSPEKGRQSYATTGSCRVNQHGEHKQKTLVIPRRTREAPASLSRLKVEYENIKKLPSTSSGPSSRTLIDSLSMSENLQENNGKLSDAVLKETTLSEAIMKSKEKNAKLLQKPKKSLKVVKVKQDKCEEPLSSTGHRNQKVEEAKVYIVKVKKFLSDENYKNFSLVLSAYKQSSDVDVLISGLTPLFTQHEAQYPLLLGFSHYIRDPGDKRKFFKAYEDITGEEVSQHCREDLKTKSRKRSDSDSEITCKVGKKMKTEGNNKTTKNEGKEKVFKPGCVDSLPRNSSSHLDSTKHLNDGRF